MHTHSSTQLPHEKYSRRNLEDMARENVSDCNYDKAIYLDFSKLVVAMGTVILCYPITADLGVEVKAKFEPTLSVVGRFRILHVPPRS